MSDSASLLSIVAVLMETGSSAERCPEELREAHSSVARASEMLHQCRKVKEAPDYGTTFTRALGKFRGFAEGYDAAKLQQIFGRRLRKLREARGLSQAQLAELSGIDRGDISRFEAGKFNISFEALERILALTDRSNR